MSKKITFFSILLLLILITLSSQDCQANTNNCAKCHPTTNLCAICTKTVYKPNQEGGCDPTHQCTAGENYCIECNNKNELCSKCEIGYYADENGGCSSTDNCVISENSKCLQCKEDFYLIEGNQFNFCKNKNTDDLKNCAEVNFSTGKCATCEENFYMSSNDNKCLNTNSCSKSAFGICTLCNNEFYLDKTDDLCKTGGYIFNNCKISLDGKICSECNDGYFLSEDGLCTKTRYCAKRGNSDYCIECSEGYFLSKSGNICTTEEHCQSANLEFGVCENCENSFYLESETRKCFSNEEDEKFKFCTKVSSGNCINCESGYQLGKDKKCSSSIKCLESENGVCAKCEEGYHLGLDNRCVNIENCIYSDISGECLECIKNYCFDSFENKCILAINQYKNCKKFYSYSNYCGVCNDDYYLSIPNKLCYSNSEEGPLYKCAITTKDGNECFNCINNYFLGVKDLKCSKIEGCAISENENKCIECDEYLCLDVKKQICTKNYLAPENEEQKIYLNCNKTNEQGTECEVCNDYSELVNGLCVDNVECAEKENGECVKCNEKSYDNNDMCLNSVYGCVETIVSNCLRCDNINNFDECTECIEGYELNDNADCVLKVEF